MRSLISKVFLFRVFRVFRGLNGRFKAEDQVSYHGMTGISAGAGRLCFNRRVPSPINRKYQSLDILYENAR